METNKVKFERKTVNIGNSLGTTIPIELIAYLELKEGDIIEFIGDEGKHGKYVALWKKNQ